MVKAHEIKKGKMDKVPPRKAKEAVKRQVGLMTKGVKERNKTKPAVEWKKGGKGKKPCGNPRHKVFLNAKLRVCNCGFVFPVKSKATRGKRVNQIVPFESDGKEYYVIMKHNVGPIQIATLQRIQVGKNTAVFWSIQ